MSLNIEASLLTNYEYGVGAFELSELSGIPLESINRLYSYLDKTDSKLNQKIIRDNMVRKAIITERKKEGKLNINLFPICAEYNVSLKEAEHIGKKIDKNDDTMEDLPFEFQVLQLLNSGYSITSAKEIFHRSYALIEDMSLMITYSPNTIKRPSIASTRKPLMLFNNFVFCVKNGKMSEKELQSNGISHHVFGYFKAVYTVFVEDMCKSLFEDTEEGKEIEDDDLEHSLEHSLEKAEINLSYGIKVKNNEKDKEIQKLYEQGYTYDQISRELELTPARVARVCKGFVGTDVEKTREESMETAQLIESLTLYKMRNSGMRMPAIIEATGFTKTKISKDISWLIQNYTKESIEKGIALL